MASNNSCSDDDEFGIPPPFFNGEKYYYWKNRMRIFLHAVDFAAWKAIENGPFLPTHIVDGFTKEKPMNEWTDDEWKKAHPDFRARNFIYCALSKDEFSQVIVMNCNTAQEMWNSLRDFYEGTGEVKMARIGNLSHEYDLFRMKHGENIGDMEIRFYDIVNHLASLGKNIPNEDLVKKVLRSLSTKWRQKARNIVVSRNLSTMHFGLLFKELEDYELEINRLEEHDETRKKKKNNCHVKATSSKDEEDDNDDSEEMNLLTKDLSKLLKKNKKSFKEGKKECKRKGSSSFPAMF